MHSNEGRRVVQQKIRGIAVHQACPASLGYMPKFNLVGGRCVCT